MIEVYLQTVANPNPTYKLKQLYDQPVADQPVAVKLPVELDAWVRSLPNKSDWLRRVIAEAYERERAKGN